MQNITGSFLLKESGKPSNKLHIRGRSSVILNCQHVPVKLLTLIQVWATKKVTSDIRKATAPATSLAISKV